MVRPPGGRSATRRYTRRTARPWAGISDSEALRLNAKFLRNGIVMLVLVAGTVALLYTWVTSSTPSTTVGYSDFLANVKAGEVQKVVQDGETLTVTPDRRRHDVHRHRPEPDHRQRARRHDRRGDCRQPAAASRRLHPQADGRHLVGRPAADGPPATPRDRRLHLLHDAPGPGHQQPGDELRQEPRPDVPRQQDGHHVRGRRGRRRGEDGAPGGRGVPQVPREVQLARRAHPARRAARRVRQAPARR